ncbi:SMI1/KNR4 family protein [Moraxella sp.]|uniref:SMI1/KNR4 family protein n=1 Tax=Moraxella sp. TaxID=479 RepID=UPI0026DBBBD3|nr:SMI1/KNR4 family protein [Moraxella sp.]MDO4895315.1 SMI1/KNR4 family protein [Moraxella sp.]
MAGHSKQTSFNPYSQEMLPEGFNYPKSYLELSKDTSTINWDSEFMFPWWFEDYGTEGAELSYMLRNKKIANSNLIPFAQNGDWKAYFNANDISGNPQVIVVDLGNTKNIEYFNNFNEWLEIAEQNGWT